jgi:hypothetical protein
MTHCYLIGIIPARAHKGSCFRLPSEESYHTVLYRVYVRVVTGDYRACCAERAQYDTDRKRVLMFGTNINNVPFVILTTP